MKGATRCRNSLWLAFMGIVSGCTGADMGTCTPGARYCEGDIVRECLPDRSGSRIVVNCAPEASCKNGACVPLQISQDAPPIPEHWDVPVYRDHPSADLDGLNPTEDLRFFDAASDLEDRLDPGPSLPDNPAPSDVPATDLSLEYGSPSDDGVIGSDATLEMSDPSSDAPDVVEEPGAARCNNGHVEAEEECDGQDFGGKTCLSLGYGPGVLSCRPDCTMDTLLCGPDTHRLVFEAIPNAWYKDDFVDVAWHPAGTYAVILNRTGAVVRFDPDEEPSQALTSIGSTGSVTPTRLAFSPSGDAFVVGYDADGVGHVFRVPDGGASIEDLPEARQPARFVSIQFDEGGDRALIAGQSGTYAVNYICVFDPSTQTTTNFKGYNASAGVTDLVWVPPGVLPAGAAALLVHGWNGKDAKLWYPISNEIVPTPGNINSFGNMGRSAWRPGGLYGLVSGTSSNVIYVFNGTWDKAYLSDTGSGILEVAFRPDGRRALVIGQPYGSPVVYHLVEHRPKTAQFSGADFVPQPIANWGTSPFFADSNTHLLAAAFRPRVRCDEGLLVGQDPSPSWNPSFGIVVRFRDSDSWDCNVRPGP